MKNRNFNQTDIISKVMAFDMSTVVKRYIKDQRINSELAQEHEIELKKFLVLCILFPDHLHEMHSDGIDELWHTFIWHTPDYINFCKTIAGKYIHHVPTTLDKVNADANIFQAKNEDCFFQDYMIVFGDVPPVHIWGIVNSTDKTDCGSRHPASCKKIDIEIEWDILTA
jgi:hypothetical protein